MGIALSINRCVLRPAAAAAAAEAVASVVCVTHRRTDSCRQEWTDNGGAANRGNYESDQRVYSTTIQAFIGTGFLLRRLTGGSIP